jgi:hypothetical protein
MKLRARDRAQLVIAAYETGLARPPERCVCCLLPGWTEGDNSPSDQQPLITPVSPDGHVSPLWC